MKIFLTGASGYIGGSVANKLLQQGHLVYGLVRSPEKAQLVKQLGISPVLGSLDDGDRLEESARSADAVINAASSDHRPAVEALVKALAESGKTLIHTSGSSIVGDDVRGESESPDVHADDALGSNSRVRAVNARRLLGWTPSGPGILEAIENNI